MKIGCTSFSFERRFKKREITLNEFMRLCKGLNIRGVEFWDEHFPTTDTQFITELRQVAESLGLHVTALAINNHGFSDPSIAKREADIERVKNWVDVAVKLNANLVRIVPGDLKLVNSDPARIYPSVREALTKCLAYAKDRNVPLAIENCPRETDPSIILKLIAELGTDHLGTCPDFGNFPVEIRYEGLKQFAPYAIHVHAKTYEFDEKGEETSIKYSRVIQILRDANYDRYLSAEYEGTGDELEGLKKTVTLIKRYLH